MIAPTLPFTLALLLTGSLGGGLAVAEPATALAVTHPSVKSTKPIDPQFQEVLLFNLRLLEIVRAKGDRANEIPLLQAIIDTYKFLEQYEQQLNFLQQLLAIRQELKQEAEVAQLLSAIGDTYANLDRYELALEAHQKSLALSRKQGNRVLETIALINLGGLYTNIGRYPEALINLQQAWELSQQDRQPNPQQVSAANQLGLLYRALGRYDRALDFYQQALNLLRQIANTTAQSPLAERVAERQITNNMGVVYDDQNQLDQALRLYQEALALSETAQDLPGQGVMLNNLAGIYLAQGSYDRALESYQKSLAIYRQLGIRSWEASGLNNIGTVYEAKGELQRALHHYRQALAINQKLGDRPSEAIIWLNMGSVYHSLQQYALAESNLRTAVQIYESLRPGLTDSNQVALFETQANAYRLLQEVLVAQNQLEAALEVSERSRARAFVELLARRVQRGVAIASPNPPRVTAPNITQIRQIARQQNATLVQYALEYERTYRRTGDITLAKRPPTNLLVWVISPTGAINFRRVDLRQASPDRSLVDLVLMGRDSLGVDSRSVTFIENAEALERARARIQQAGQQDPNLQALHRLLIQPIAEFLPKNPTERVILIPQGVLFLAPFAAFTDAQGYPLIAKHTLLVSPSIQVLELTYQQRQRQLTRATQPPKGQEVLVVGNPMMPLVSLRPGDPPQPLSRLPGAEQEAKTIAALFQTQALVGDRATKARVLQQMPTARIIHLATHGLLEDLDRAGVPGAIALAPDRAAASNNAAIPEGLLTASEIITLTLRAELVVLSACDTGRGQLTGDGVIGLSRSLIAAGVTSVMVSLWKVPDESTAFLMTQFYENLQKTRDRAQALRQAMLTTRQQYPDPLDWAGFVLIGEAE